MCLYITGHLNSVFPAEHRKEILRDIYNHQVRKIVLNLSMRDNISISSNSSSRSTNFEILLLFRTKTAGGDCT